MKKKEEKKLKLKSNEKKKTTNKPGKRMNQYETKEIVNAQALRTGIIFYGYLHAK